LIDILLQIIATMDLSTQLFENAPVGIDGVLGQICQIVVTHWKPLVMITRLELVAFIGAYIVLGGFTFLVSAKYIAAALSAILQKIMPTYTRHLLDYSVGISGASRFLGEDYYDDLPQINAKFIAALWSCLLW
jgi:hypothetical protein